MKSVNLKLTVCNKCPNWTDKRYYTADSFENVMEWLCTHDNVGAKRITLQDTFDKDPEIPNWCPLS